MANKDRSNSRKGSRTPVSRSIKVVSGPNNVRPIIRKLRAPTPQEDTPPNMRHDSPARFPPNISGSSDVREIIRSMAEEQKRKVNFTATKDNKVKLRLANFISPPQVRGKLDIKTERAKMMAGNKKGLLNTSIISPNMISPELMLTNQ